MKHSTDWQEPAPGIVVITPEGGGLVRLVGLFLAAPGAWLLYHFVMGMFEGGLTIAGWLILPIFAALFLVPGWIILFGRKRTRLDVTRREATEEFDFLVYTRRKITRIPQDAHVMMRYERGGKSETRGPLTTSVSTGYMLNVYLDPSPPRPEAHRPGLILLSIFGSDEKPAAMEFAQKVGALFAIRVEDRCFEGGEVTSAGVVVDRLDSEEAD